MKRTFALLLCLCLFLSACGKQPEVTDPTTSSTAAPTTEATTEPTEATTEPTTEPTTVPTTEPVVLNYRHPITGQPIAEPMTVRPVAVSTNNYRDAQPVIGTSHADIIFEHVTEGLGSETRMLAVYTDLNFDDKLGSVRSARTYSVSMAMAFNAIFVHCGGSTQGLDKLNNSNYPSFDQFYNGNYFYRDSARKAAGLATEHTLVTEGNMLKKGISTKKWTQTIPEDTYYGFDFSDEADLNGDAANTVTIQYYDKNGKYTIMEYDKSSGMYYGTQKWYKKQAAIADGNTNDPIPFKNILVLKTTLTHDPNTSHVYMELTGTGNGFLIRDGEYVAIKWHRASEKQPFTYTLADGSPVTFGVGKTFVSVLPTRSPEVIFE